MTTQQKVGQELLEAAKDAELMLAAFRDTTETPGYKVEGVLQRLQKAIAKVEGRE